MFRRRRNKAAKAAKKDRKDIKSPSAGPSNSSSENTSNPAATSLSSSSNDKSDSVLQSSSSQTPSSMDQENNANNSNNSNNVPQAQPVAKERSLKSLRSLISRGSSKDGSKPTFNKSKSTEKPSFNKSKSTENYITLHLQATSSSQEASLSQPMVQSTTTSIGTEKTQKTQNVSIIGKEEPTKILQVNYDVNPTLLYKFIEYKDWNEVLNRIRDAPEETKIWVYRLEQYNPEDDTDEMSMVVPDESEIRWKMLPIHVAIIFDAPIKVVMALHKANPNSLSQCDDRKMLPIHLACRVVSNVSVAQFLIYKNADSLEAMDYKGRKPMNVLKEYGVKELNSSDKRTAKNRAKLIKLMEEKLNQKKEDDAKSATMNIEEDADEVEEDQEEEEEDDEEEDEDDEEEEDETDVQDKENTKVVTNSLKLQRPEPVETIKEVDYDTYPTVLIKLIERKLWEQAITRCSEVPQEAATWMSRLQEVKDKEDGKENEIRWRILPIHSAIVLHAPVEVIEALVEAYPKGLHQGDDREMLPLHMAFRLGSSPETAAVLVDAYPEALKKRDSRGHTPLHILKAYRRKYIKDRENGKKNVSEMDANRKKLIKFYLGGRRYGESTDEPQVKTFDSDSDSDYDSDDDSDYDSDDDEPLFYKEMFNDFAKLTTQGISQGISSFPNIMRNTLACRGGSYED